MKIINICIAGNFSLAIESTKYIIKNFKKIKLYSILNKNDNGKDTFQPSFKKFCLKNKIEIISLEDAYKIKNMIFFSLHFDKILKVENFSTSKLFNIHFSLLPKYKGMHTTAWPILNGEKKTGVTLHKIDNGIDTGPIISRLSFDIKINDTAEIVFLNYIRYGVKLFKKNISSILREKIYPIRQNMFDSTYYSTKSLNFKNFKIDLNKTAYEIHNQVRSLIFEYYQLPTIYGFKIVSSAITKKKSVSKPGKIIFKNKQKIILSSIDYNLLLKIK